MPPSQVAIEHRVLRSETPDAYVRALLSMTREDATQLLRDLSEVQGRLDRLRDG
jgi:hypothetical protein